jgi:putative peptidoglycan lipid II flippase
VVSLATIQVNWLITTALASSLNPGNLAALSYAWAIAMLPLGVFGIAPATAAFPSLAQAAAQSNWRQYQEMLSGGLRLALFLTIPGSVGLLLLREPLVALLFQRGLFDAESTRLTATALLFFGTGLAAHAVLEVVSRGSYALRDTKTPLVFALVGMASHLVFSLLLVGPLGSGGLALAMSLATALETGGLLLALTGRVVDFDWKAVGVSAGKSLIATALMGVAVIWILGLFSWTQEPQGLLLMVLAGTLFGLTVFVGVAALLRSSDLKVLWQELGVGR